MSVSFDVLDSLNSIRNVEDLKKRWEEDSKRPQTQSYKAVDLFVEFFLNPKYDIFAHEIAFYFAMCYREAVKQKICTPDDQVWIMPYVRYAESLKGTYEEASYFDSLLPALDIINGLENKRLVLSKKHCDTMIEFFNIIDDACRGGDRYCIICSFSDIPDKTDGSYDPWGFFKGNDYENFDWWKDRNSIVPFVNYLEDCRYDLGKATDFWKKLSSNLNENIYPSVQKELDNMKSELPELEKMIGQYIHFKAVIISLNHQDLKMIERLNTISQLGFPEHFIIKLTYKVEPLIVAYIKSKLKNNLTSEELNKFYEQFKSLKHIMAADLFEYCSKEYFSGPLYEAAIREDERKKVMFEISHSIKNLMASVSEPLDMLKDQLEGTQRRTVENALAGAGLIRDLAVGVHMSMRGEPGMWRKDVLEPGFGAATLDKIILDAMRHAVSNMFDGKYFAQFVKNYFGRDLNTFMQAQNEWKAAVSAEDTFACINKYFFDFKIDCGESSLNIPVGDRDGTATKLLILFQELFLNAVKYSSFTEREKRFVKLDVAITPENWNIKLSNSAVGRQNAKSSGIGLAVIKNFADLFEAKYDANCKNDTYISSINFSLNK